jgi:hypothetical protein
MDFAFVVKISLFPWLLRILRYIGIISGKLSGSIISSIIIGIISGSSSGSISGV